MPFDGHGPIVTYRRFEAFCDPENMGRAFWAGHKIALARNWNVVPCVKLISGYDNPSVRSHISHYTLRSTYQIGSH